MADRRHIEDQRNPREVIVDAEFVEIDNDAPASHHRQPPQFEKDSAWHVWWNGQLPHVRAAWILAPLVLLGMCSRSIPPSDDAPTEEATTQALAAPPQAIAPKQPDMATNASADEVLIDACYRYDSCAKLRILDNQRAAKQGDERLMRATLLLGTIPYTPGGDAPNGPIQWERQSKTYYAVCSRTRPLIAFRIGPQWWADSFDFVGGIPGMQQDNANIYEALCHGYFSGELAANARSLGYLPNDEAGDLFKIDSPLRLLPRPTQKDDLTAPDDREVRNGLRDMDEVIDGAVGRSIPTSPIQSYSSQQGGAQ